MISARRPCGGAAGLRGILAGDMGESWSPSTRRDTSRPGWAHNYSRPDDVLPSYADSVRWFFYNSLRPTYLFTSFLSAVAAAILCGIEWRSMARRDGKAKVLSIVSAALYTACAALQAYALFAGIRDHIHLLRSAVRLAWASMGMALAAAVIAVANVYANEWNIISACITEYVSTDMGPIEEDGTAASADREDASDVCKYNWNEDAVWNIAWLVIIALFSVLYVLLAHRFLGKVENPGFSEARTRPFTADDNHDFAADMDAPNAYAMGGLGPRASRSSLDDEALIDAKMDPMADVYGGRRDPGEDESSAAGAADAYPPVRPGEADVPPPAYAEPTIVPVRAPRRP